MPQHRQRAHALASNAATLITMAGLTGLTTADDLQPTALEVDGYADPHGYVYINQGTGERVVSFEKTESTQALRGTVWSWHNDVIDPCTPTPDTPVSTAIFTGVMDDKAGDMGTIDAVNYWNDWFEAPGDTVISTMSFGHFSQLLDPGEDGVDGQELIFAFTESDRANSQTTALAHSPILVGNLIGAEDDGADGAAIAGDGIIDFAEGNYWIYFVDFGTFDTPTDIEVADTNGVSDGAFGADSTFSGIPGVDINGNGLFNCGFSIGIRQPDVAEGDGLIHRFPELAFLGLENPDGFDAASLANITPSGFPLLAPSNRLDSYLVGSPYWPQAPDYIPLSREAVGSTDAFGFYNTVGVSTGTFFFGGFECDPNAVAAPFYLNPWSTPDIRFNISSEPKTCFALSCNFTSCYAEPTDVIDLADITAFLQLFLAGDPEADIALPIGIFDLADLTTFIAAFLAGCP